MTFEETMAFGADQYADVLTSLNDSGLPAVFTQTGGMCAAIEVQLETGHTLLITDADDTLAWYRSEHQGWGVGLYAPDTGDRDGVVAFEQSKDGDLKALERLLRAVLLPPATTR